LLHPVNNRIEKIRIIIFIIYLLGNLPPASKHSFRVL